MSLTDSNILYITDHSLFSSKVIQLVSRQIAVDGISTNKITYSNVLFVAEHPILLRKLHEIIALEINSPFLIERLFCGLKIADAINSSLYRQTPLLVDKHLQNILPTEIHRHLPNELRLQLADLIKQDSQLQCLFNSQLQILKSELEQQAVVCSRILRENIETKARVSFFVSVFLS